MPWPAGAQVHDSPAVLSDGRGFAVAAVLDGGHVVGQATAGSLQQGDQPGDVVTWALVVVDPLTARVIRTLDTGQYTRAESWRGAEFVDVVSSDGAAGSWVTWVNGREGDDGVLSNVTVHAENLATGRRLVLGTAAFGDSAAPVISGGVAAWAADGTMHAYALADRRRLYDARIHGGALVGLNWPWLNYVVRSGAGPASFTATFHSVDLRTGADRVTPGPCDGTWCQTSEPADRPVEIGLVRQQPPGSSARRIAANLGGFGGFGGFSSSAAGFFLWSDIDPYRPDWGTAEDPAPADMPYHQFLYDPQADRNIELPPLQNDVAFLSGDYLVWEELPAAATSAGKIHFVDLAELH